jgi:hypothetical protein
MRMNLDVFGMCPSVEPTGRRFASLHRVLRGEFPCFIGTIKALRLPAALPDSHRFLRLAVPPRPLVLFAPQQTSALLWPGVVDPVSPAGISQRKRQDLPGSWGTPSVRSPCSVDAGRTARTRPYLILLSQACLARSDRPKRARSRIFSLRRGWEPCAVEQANGSSWSTRSWSPPRGPGTRRRRSDPQDSAPCGRCRGLV